MRSSIIDLLTMLNLIPTSCLHCLNNFPYSIKLSYVSISLIMIIFYFNSTIKEQKIKGYEFKLTKKNNQYIYLEVIEVKLRKIWYVLAIFTTIIFVVAGCGGDNNEYDVDLAGQEKTINGTWTGKYSHVNFTMQLSDGKILVYRDLKLGWRLENEGGYIGMYSLNEDGNFHARLNSRSPGAPVGFVTDEIEGKLANGVITGKWIYLMNGTPSKSFDFRMTSK